MAWPPQHQQGAPPDRPYTRLDYSSPEWVKGHNHQVKQEGGVRLLSYLLPIKSPWLNPQEPHWVHCKRNVVEPKETLTVGQLKERIGSYFNSDAPLESLNLSLVDLH
jgi:hypothetical protein